MPNVAEKDVAKNRQRLLKVMDDVIDKRERFDIHSIVYCPLAYYRSSGIVPSNTPIFEYHVAAREFALSLDVVIDLFALNHAEHKGAKDKEENATYHRMRIAQAFIDHPI